LSPILCNTYNPGDMLVWKEEFALSEIPQNRRVFLVVEQRQETLLVLVAGKLKEINDALIPFLSSYSTKS
jgi:hypothetical protein